MNDLIDFLTSKEIIVVYIVIGIACLLCFIVYLVDKTYYKRKRKHNTRELKRLVEEINETLQEETPEVIENKESTEIYQTPVLTKIDEPEEKKVIEEISPVVKEEQLEILEPEILEAETVQDTTSKVEDLVLETMVESKEPVEVIEEKESEEIMYTSIEPNKEEAQAELLKLTEELEKAEQEVKNINLTAYEEEQEENAIISLEELVKKSKEMYEANEITQYADEGNEPISIADLELRMQATKQEEPQLEVVEKIETLEQPVITPIDVEEEKEQVQQLVLSDFNTVEIPEKTQEYVAPTPGYQTTKKFQSSPVISPIYGIEKKEASTAMDMELENTANYEKLDEEIKKTNEFLMTLKELQKNLD